MPDQVNLYAIGLGGALALLGTVTSQIFGLLTGFIDRRHQRTVKQLERLERLSDAVSDSLGWFSAISKCKTLDDYSSTQIPASARQAAMIARLYFPTLTQPTQDYLDGLIRYYGFAGECMVSPHPITLGAKISLAIKNDPSLVKWDTEPQALRQRLDDAIATEAKKLH